MEEYLEIYARLNGRILGISYWIAYVTYFTWGCLVITDFYVRYLLDQDINVIEQVQVVKTILCCLLSITVAIPLASKKILILCGIFLVKNNLPKQPICSSCQRENLNRALCAETAWLKTM